MTAPNLLRSAAAAGLLAFALAGCGSDKDSASPSAPTGKGATGATVDKIDVKDFAYKPETANVKVGTKVTWTFSDSAKHNVEPVGDSELKLSPDLADGKTYEFTFTKAGTVKYRCGIHNSMTGTVVVA